MNPDKYSFLRFSYDKKTNSSYFYDESITNSLFENTICINDDLMPDHSEKINIICKKIKINRKKIRAFVTPDLEINAKCLPCKDVGILYFNSSLINLLSLDEFCFVAAHEIGHFVFEHGEPLNMDDIKDISQSKFQEVSCDRVGMFISQDIKSCISALIKISTGLNDKHFKLNVSSILEQEDFISDENFNKSSHPSLISRIKALLLFNSMLSEMGDADSTLSSVLKIDKQIKNDIEKNQKNFLNLVKDKYKFWFTLKLIISDKKFSKDEQKKFQNFFGKKKFEQAFHFLKVNTHSNAIEIIERNTQEFKTTINDDSITELIETDLKKNFL